MDLPVKVLQEERARVHHQGNHPSAYCPEPVAELEDEVVSGDLAGYVHQPETPGAIPDLIHFTVEGLVI